MELIINLGLILSLVFIGLVFGMINEKRHYKSIQEREKEFINLPAISLKRLEGVELDSGELVIGSVAVSIDYFKRIVATLINIIGGNVVSYESLIDRGRREAILRMKEMAKTKGYDQVINVRIETSTISGRSKKKNDIGCIEVLAFGTGIKSK